MSPPSRDPGSRFRIGARLLFLIFLLGSIRPGGAAAADPYDEALARYRAGDYRGAIDRLREKPGMTGGDHSLLGWAYLRSGQTASALSHFERAAARDPGASDPRCGEGYAHLHLGNPSRALASFASGIDLDPENVDCLLGRGYALERLERGDEALGAFRAVLAIDPSNEVAAGRIAAAPRPPPKPAAGAPRSFFARGNTFWVSQGGGEPEPIYVNGINFGFALPGRYPTEFPESEAEYREWFRKAAEMNANTIRVYTILPPAFYAALARFNAEPEARAAGEPPEAAPPGARKRRGALFLIQGIWAEPPPKGGFRDPRYLEELRGEIRRAVDAVHGRARIPKRPGHAHGAYAADVSPYVLGYLFGHEWEPPDVASFLRKDPAARYSGRFLSVAEGNPMEAWIAEMLDTIAAYETDAYGSARPVACMNWPPLDPLSHPSEATLREEYELRTRKGEVLGPVDFGKAYDDDAVSVDETRIVVHPDFRGGLFVSYHVYPYYPDFLINEPNYGERSHPEGASRYFNYLRDLKAHYRDLPLLIAEFGLPTSRGVARFHPEGLDHGGHSEQSQADGNVRMARSIREAGCAGGIVFAWIDEWTKSNWMARGTEERDPFWYNAQDPEESYGIVSASPAASPPKLSGDPDAWKGAKTLSVGGSSGPRNPLRDGFDESRHLLRMLADADPGYLYLRLDLGGRPDWDRAAYLIAIDTIGTESGDPVLPFGLDFEGPVGFEFVVLLHGENSLLLADDPYVRMVRDPAPRREEGLSGWIQSRSFGTVPNRNGRFSRIVTVHRRRFGRDGTVYPEKVYDASRLRSGDAGSDSRADFHYGEGSRMLEVRIPWSLLNVADPSTRRVNVSGTERATTEGFRILAVSYRPSGSSDPTAVPIPGQETITDLLPEDPAQMVPYSWKAWTEPAFFLRPKRSYFALRELYAGLGPVPERLLLPAGFDFSEVVKLHYNGSTEEFLAQYRDSGPGTDRPYGLALAALVRGLVGGNPFHVHEARSLFAQARDRADDPREREIASRAFAYAGHLLSGTLPHADAPRTDPERISILRDPPPEGPVRTVILGNSAIRVGPSTRIRTQVDRVTRDWLSAYNPQAAPGDLVVERLVPWHEGEKIALLSRLAGSQASPVWGTYVRKFPDGWYAPDAEGRFRFRLHDDKVLNYPTTILLDDRNAIVNDTHGLSAIAWNAADADLAIGCGDSEGKAEAAYDLALRGVDVYLPTDRNLDRLLGARAPGTILGSAPVREVPGGAVIGDQPIRFGVDETIVVSDSDGTYPLHYYDTPRRYFRALEAYLGIPLRIVPVNVPKDGGADRVVSRARETGASLLGIRVRSKEEHDAVAGWLQEDPRRRAVLFHTAVYPEGFRLYREFPRQTSFGDIRPGFE